MSKLDAQRAMREARYEQEKARGANGAATPRVSQPPAVASPQPTAESCGHRSMNGRTCTREQGHAAKSHRYS